MVKELPRVMAYFQPQAWINDYATNIDGGKKFDCTKEILRMSAAEIKALADDQYNTDGLAECRKDVFGGHSGPFYVAVEEAVADFFHAHKLEITDESLAKLRKLYKVRLPSPKKGRA